MIQPRYYQQEAIDSIFSYFMSNKGNPVVAMPTGTGKSIVIGGFVKQVLHYYPGQRIHILTHVKELIQQNYDKLLTMWPHAPAGVYSAGLRRKEANFPITFGGIGSIHKKAEMFGRVDLLIVDECHLISPKADTLYQAYINQLKRVNPFLKVIGLTATPYRQGMGMITQGGIFTDMCYDLTSMANFNRLVEEGYLAKLVTRKTKHEVDLTGVKVQNGEFSAHDLQAALDKDSITNAALDELEEHGYNRNHWLLFASGVEHAKHLTEKLISRGVSAVCVDGEMPTAERDAAINEFKSGRVRAAVNNNVLTTGFDFPGIDLIGMLRPTRSTGLWVQMLGRGTRPDEHKDNCLVLDFAGNTGRLGPINDPVLPTPKGQGKAGTAPVKWCPECDHSCHASATQCEHCGALFPREIKIQRHASDKEVMISVSKPEIIEVPVLKVHYAIHNKPNSPPSLQVSYYCPLAMYREWVHFERDRYARIRAVEWWRQRSSAEVPMTTAGALELCPQLPVPRSIRVWINKKFPEVMSATF